MFESRVFSNISLNVPKGVVELGLYGTSIYYQVRLEKGVLPKDRCLILRNADTLGCCGLISYLLRTSRLKTRNIVIHIRLVEWINYETHWRLLMINQFEEYFVG